MTTWTDKQVAEVLATLESDPEKGLTGETARRRLAEHGTNELTGHTGRNVWRILLDQFASLMVLLLIAAAAVSGLALGEVGDAVVILIVVILNAALGFRQEFKAEQAMAALKKMTVPVVRVRRDGELKEIPALQLVPGDITQFEAGNLVPADCRLIESANLRIQESALTGEAEPVEKQCDPLPQANLPLGDRSNMAYMGTVITYGRGVGMVTETGMRTELGRIAGMIQEAEEEDTVLQRKLNALSRMLVAAALVLIAVVAAEARWILHLGLKEIFMTAVSMAVAAIPEGLPAAVTISLAIGAQRMLKRRALIRRLPAVETLGSVTVICSDKTGTLTQNRMTVTDVVTAARHIDVEEQQGARCEQLQRETQADTCVGLILAGAALCNDAALEPDESPDQPGIIGDPTEGALVVAATWAGWTQQSLQGAFPRINERPFDSERKRMTTLHEVDPSAASLGPAFSGLNAWLGDNRLVAFTKGAADSILEAADRVWIEGEAQPLNEEQRAKLSAMNEELAGDGTRVLGVAMREWPRGAEHEAVREEGLVYLGMVGMLDPLRTEVPPAVETCHKAGIRPIMITGDHPLIARNIGRALQLKSAEGHLTGRDLAGMDRKSLEKRVPDVSIYARVSPEHKLKIVDALQKNGHVVAMTGDGVNDAPALKEADIGVAMGITGTDVSKEAADMVLQDDNFATIVAAVEQGRIILDNIIRFVRYILASNWAEILVMLAAPLFGLPLPLLPVQILWMNLVTDGLPALALGVEPGEKNVMRRPPRSPQAPILDWTTGSHILLVGGLMALFSLLLGRAFFDGAGAAAASTALGHGHAAYGLAMPWQTMVFTVLVFSQLTLALAERSNRESFFAIGVFTNPYMVGAVALTFGLQAAVIYVPFLQKFFRTSALSFRELGICLLVGFAIFAVVELKKLITRKLGR